LAAGFMAEESSAAALVLDGEIQARLDPADE